MDDTLTQELQTYEANFESLLGAHEGKFVLRFNDRIWEHSTIKWMLLIEVMKN